MEKYFKKGVLFNIAFYIIKSLIVLILSRNIPKEAPERIKNEINIRVLRLFVIFLWIYKTRIDGFINLDTIRFTTLHINLISFYGVADLFFTIRLFTDLKEFENQTRYYYIYFVTLFVLFIIELRFNSKLTYEISFFMFENYNRISPNPDVFSAIKIRQFNFVVLSGLELLIALDFAFLFYAFAFNLNYNFETTVDLEEVYPIIESIFTIKGFIQLFIKVCLYVLIHVEFKKEKPLTRKLMIVSYSFILIIDLIADIIGIFIRKAIRIKTLIITGTVIILYSAGIYFAYKDYKYLYIKVTQRLSKFKNNNLQKRFEIC
ncbi:hypothetical protein A0H76_2921 [Hepatospora eriocheir]|uniref:Uncharacterized protein n=1 Tax=Hepatospora eriocheir TaxID=1081669 RepID=A0A1X0Q5L7_9MICR|nr:hypothetical protein A0H76_2921 [Hepatospora eriocheir]